MRLGELMVCSLAHARRPLCANVPTPCGRPTTLSLVTAGVEPTREGAVMNSIVYIVGAVVIIVAILSFFGLR
jgi:hypothetical protein